MIGTFSKGLLASGVVPTLRLRQQRYLGATVWVGTATRAGLPVSTTHAIVGSVIAARTIAYRLSRVKLGNGRDENCAAPAAQPRCRPHHYSLLLRTWKYFAVPIGDSAECLCTEVESGSVAATTTISR